MPHSTPPTAPAPSTRADWERLADRLLLAVRPYASERHALIGLPGTASVNGSWSDGLEGFARTFLLAAFRLAGARGHDPHGLAEWYAAGIVAGVDPASEERWPTFAESNQAKVEAASIAIALHETRPWIWDRLPDRTRHQLHDWLGDMVGNTMPGNNWIWFQAITEAFARTTGGAWRAGDLTRTIELTEDWYAGDGWYSDGLSGGAHRNYDHYNGWAMHFYPLWFCRILGDQAPGGLLDRYRTRLRRFLDDARHLVGGNGSPLIQGRSLTYRFAALAPVWTGALFDATPLPPGQTRRLANRMLDHFTGHGAIDERGLLTLGWHRPFRPVLQVYSGPASPYWASKGFAGLLLPDGHPAWTAPESPLPVESGDFARTLRAPGWLVSGTRADGVVRIVNHGSDHADPARPHSDDPLYARLAFSTHAAPETPSDPRGGPVDSSVVLLDADGRASHRRPLERVMAEGRVAVSRSRAHWPEDERWDCFGGPDTAYRLGPWITVASVLRGTVEVRLVRVDPAPGDDPGPWRLRLGGWAVAEGEVYPHSGLVPLPVSDENPESATGSGAGSGSGSGSVRDSRSGSGSGSRSGSAAVPDSGSGFDETDVHHGTDTNALGTTSATPTLSTPGDVVFARPYAAAVHLGGSALSEDRIPRVRLRPRTTDATGTTDAHTIVADVLWPDGQLDSVPLPGPASPPAPASPPVPAQPSTEKEPSPHA
ncbi:DUF2264 domain-containing protein [Streptomyces sp. NPDC056937]|uniref:DUF2264 domain-containing protein n=1 Tax=Streptomyces sp. NPDC056937 TaxID=3345969 RepID=UPI0036318100